MTLFLAIGLPPNRLLKRKKTKAFGLALLTYNLGRVGRFIRNPALPTNQPLRGSWYNEFLLFQTRVDYMSYSTSEAISRYRHKYTNGGVCEAICTASCNISNR